MRKVQPVAAVAPASCVRPVVPCANKIITADSTARGQRFIMALLGSCEETHYHSSRYTRGEGSETERRFGVVLEGTGEVKGPILEGRTGPLESLVTAASARASAASAASAAAAAALARLVAIPAKHRAVATRFKGHCCRLTAAGTDHRRSCGWCRTVAGASPTLVILLCHTARLAPLGGRVAAFLKERLISSGEGEILPAIAAS